MIDKGLLNILFLNDNIKFFYIGRVQLFLHNIAQNDCFFFRALTFVVARKRNNHFAQYCARTIELDPFYNY